jgi:hypothetical protein
MLHIPTRIQLADIITNPVNEDTFYRHSNVILVGEEPRDDLQLYLHAKDQYDEEY